MRPVRGGRVITTVENQELITNSENGLVKVTVCNQSNNEIHIIINNGSQISLDVDESISLSENIRVISLIVVETGSKVRYIGV
jgi:hypothetical protein